MKSNLNSNIRVVTNGGIRSTAGTVRTSSVQKPANVRVVTASPAKGKISGYTPLMMQGSIAPQNRLSTAIISGSNTNILHPTNSTKQSTFQPKQSQYRQARELLLQPGFEAQA